MKSLSELSIDILPTENIIYILEHYNIPKTTKNYMIQRISGRKLKPRNAKYLYNTGVETNSVKTMMYKTNFSNIPNISQFEKNLIRMRNLHGHAKFLVPRRNYNSLPQYVKSFNYNKNYSHPVTFQKSGPYIRSSMEKKLPKNFVNKILRENMNNKDVINEYRKLSRRAQADLSLARK